MAIREQGRGRRRCESSQAREDREATRTRGDEQDAKLLGLPVSELRAKLDEAKRKLLDVRSRRVWPGRDEKILTSWNALATNYPQFAQVPGAAQAPNQTLMELSGTSVAAPVVSGAVALMLQVNPGLTPPLVKAILQYTAQPLPNANLLQQGTGLLNIEGAVGNFAW